MIVGSDEVFTSCCDRIREERMRRRLYAAMVVAHRENARREKAAAKEAKAAARQRAKDEKAAAKAARQAQRKAR